jgi:ketosteroid isomerase-like protein
MSEGHVQFLRRVYERWERGDFDAGAERYDAEIELVLRPEFPDPGTYRGREGIGRYMRDLFLADLEEATISGEEFLDAGDSVLVRVRQRATGPASGAPVEMRYFQVWTFRGDRVIRIESVRERADALEVAGLPAEEGG